MVHTFSDIFRPERQGIMALQNIGSENKDDGFYRYKMPKMITKIEGRGNGIKTNVVNMVDIAKALARPASYTTKYFGCELGAQSKFDDKTGVSLVNGAHDTTKLAALLENFIKKYVQCYGCGNPETEILISRSQMITLKCAACGFVSDVDMRDKLTTFILKNPPEQKKGGKDKKAMRRAEKERLKEGEAADEEQKKLKKERESKKKVAAVSTKDGTASKSGKKKAPSGSDEDRLSPARSQDEEEDTADGYVDDDVQWRTDTSREAAQKRIQEQLSAATAEMVMLSTEESMDKKEVKKPAPKAKENGTGAATVQDTLLSDIRSSLKKDPSPAKLKAVLDNLSCTPQEATNALFEALFEGAGKGFSKDVAKKKKYLKVATEEEGSQMLLLRAFEAFCGKANPDAVREAGLVLKVLYDDDLLEEEFITKWYDDAMRGESKDVQLWKAVGSFVEWLRNAESESEEE